MDAVVCRGDAAIAQSKRLTAGQAARCLTEFESLRPVSRIADRINRHERLVVIDDVHQAIRGQIDLFSELDTFRWLVNAGVDWNAVLRIVNCVIDDLVAVLRIQSYPERTRRLCNLVDEHERGFTASKTDADARVAAITGMTYEISTYLGHWHARIINTLADVSFVQARDEARRRMVRLAFALAAYRADRGVYPEELETLIPEHIDEVPLDPFTAAPLRYERTGPDEYRLYSVGDNLTDDGGRGHESDPPGDDIAIGVPSTNRPGEPGPHVE